jgi:hypothetical protein
MLNTLCRDRRCVRVRRKGNDVVLDLVSEAGIVRRAAELEPLSSVYP